VSGVVLVAATLAVGCSRQAEVKPAPEPAATEAASHAEWTKVAVADMTPEQKAEQQKCEEAVKTMSGRLMSELTTALDSGGPAGAIEVCRSRAPEIAAAISNEYGLLIGRTSFRLRNPANAPPEWAAKLVEERVAEPTWLASPDGRLGGLLPIRLKAECGMCHGPKEQIAPQVLSTIEESYPDDAATGFKEGDLRGWFWVATPSRT
jgi:hypothetical protein